MDDLKHKRGARLDDDRHSQPTSVPAGYTPEALSEVSAVNDDGESMIGQVVAGKYRIERKIGQGGMGEVFLALNDELGQRVAIKFLNRKLAHDEGLVARFLNEARSYCRVNHPNAVTLLEYGQHTDHTLYIITEFVEGKNLGETLKEAGTFSTAQVVQVGMQLCEVLATAHAQGVIHRDLKPDNVMMMPVARGRLAVKVLDFGIAKMVDDDDAPTTETGSVFGTPEFMSPEQARGDGADPRSDIYALGIILFFMVTGKLPFRGKNKLAVLNKQLNDPPPRPSELRPEAEISPRLEAVIMKCLNKSPDARYATAEDLHEALEELTTPAGSMTAKVRTSDVSAPPKPKAVKAPTVRLGGPADSDEFGETLAALDEPSGMTDLDSIDISREAINLRPGRAVGYRSVFDAKVVVGIGVLLGIVALVGWRLATDVAEPSPIDVENVLLTGQVLGVLAASETMLESGSVEAAREALDQTLEWIPRGALPETEEDRREALDERIRDLEARREAFLTAMRANDCATALRVQEGLVQGEPGLADRLKRQARRCLEKPRSEAPSNAVRPQMAPVKPVAAQVKPVAAPVKVVEPPPKPAQDIKPQPVVPAEKPPVVLPEASVKPVEVTPVAPSEKPAAAEPDAGSVTTPVESGLPPKQIAE